MMGLCEVCGGPIRDPPSLVNIDGTLFTVCSICARLGDPARAPRPIKQTLTPRPGAFNSELEEAEMELKRDFNQLLRRARERAGLSQEELGKRINEKPSVMRLLESGRLKPDMALAMKIEHFLKQVEGREASIFEPAEEGLGG